jgi:hypothetical protein
MNDKTMNDIFYTPVITLGGQLTSMAKEKRVSMWGLVRARILEALNG